MRKFAFVAMAVLISVALGGWISSTAPPVNGAAGIDPMQIMVGSLNLPAEHFVDYALVYP